MYLADLVKKEFPKRNENKEGEIKQIKRNKENLVTGSKASTKLELRGQRRPTQMFRLSLFLEARIKNCC